MDEHASRVIGPVLELLASAREGTGSAGDLLSSVAAAAGALDSSNAELRDALKRLDSELESVRFTVSQDEQIVAIQHAVGPLIALVDRS